MEAELDYHLNRLAEDALPLALVFRAGELSHEEYMRLSAPQRHRRYTLSAVAGKGGLVYLGQTAIAAADVDEKGSSVHLRDDGTKASARAAGAQIRVVVSVGRAWRAPEELSFRPGDRVVLDQPADAPLAVFMPGTDAVWMKGEAVTVDDFFGVRLQSCAPETRSHERGPDRVELEVLLGEGVFPIADVAGAGDGTICPLETPCLEPMTVTSNGVPLARGYLEVTDESPGRLVFVVTKPLGGKPEHERDDDAGDGAAEDVSPSTGSTGTQVSIDAVLDHYPLHRLFVMLEHEAPQTAAWIVKRLAVLDGAKARQVFSALRDRLEASFVPLFALGRPFTTPRGVCTAVAESMLDMLPQDERQALLDEIEAFSGVSMPEPPLGPDAHLRTTADVLAVLPEREVRKMLERIGEVDPQAAQQIEGCILFVADIARLSDRNIQKLLRELDMQDLVLCLTDADEALRSAVLRNMSARAAHMLEEERGFLKDPNPAAVDEAKAKVLRILSTLIENGDVTL